MSIEAACGQASVERGCLKSKVKDQAIVQILLDAERHLSAGYRTVVRKADLQRDVEAGVVVGMNVKSQGDRQKCPGIQVDFNLAKMLEKVRGWTGGGELLANAHVLNDYGISGFMTHIGCNIA